MQEVLRWEKSISEYKSGFSTIEKESPSKCGECGSAKFYKWGTYKRYVAEEYAEHRIPVQRFRCVKCRRTCSYLPSFCLRGLCYSADLVMKLLGSLLLKIRFEFGEKRRRAYILLRRFLRMESLWLVFLRARRFGDIPNDRMERGVKIFTALQEVYRTRDFTAIFLKETGRHFMSAK